MSGEEDLMKQVEELKRRLREVEEEKEEMRRGWEEEEREETRRGREEARVRGESRGREESRGGKYMMRVSGAGGLASRAMGSAVQVKQQGTENNDMRQFYFPSGHLNTRPPRFPTDPAKVLAWRHRMMLFPNSHGLGYIVKQTFTAAGDAKAEAIPSTGGTAAPVASAETAARKLASAAGSAGEICGERGASTHPFDPATVFPLEVRYSSVKHAKYNSSGSSSSSSSNDNTRGHDSWWDTTCVGALLRPFDLGKRCRQSARRGKAVLGVDRPFHRGRAWGRMQHGG